MLNLSCKKTYDGKVVLDVGGLIFEKGKRYAVIGSNGSGKTTMLKIIGGLIKPEQKTLRTAQLSILRKLIIFPQTIKMRLRLFLKYMTCILRRQNAGLIPRLIYIRFLSREYA